MSIYKTYDIRGVYPDELKEEDAYKIGRAFVIFSKAKHVVVGRDARTSSPSLFEQLAKGITDQGADVWDIGIVTNPMTTFSVLRLKADAGIVLSASHNPKQYNGFKLQNSQAIQLTNLSDVSFNGIEVVEKLVEKNDFPEPSKKGSIIENNIIDDYVKKMLSFAKLGERKVKVVVDCGNGVAGISAKPVLDALGVDYIPLFFEPDGSFPNHDANPADEKTFKWAKEALKENKADFAILFDGDGDRLRIMDEQGTPIALDYISAIYCDHLLEEKKGHVFFDLRFSKAMEDVIEKKGGIAHRLRVGNPFYKYEMRKLMDQSVYGAELSGHIFFPDNDCLDDATLAMIKFLNIITNTDKTVSELVKPFMKYPKTPEINSKVKDADVVLQEIENTFNDGKVEHVDGVSVYYDDAWLNLRKSNTEPVVRFVAEADTEERLEEIKKTVLGIIEHNQE